MSACASLPISAAAVGAGHARAGADVVSPGLLAALAQAKDPRAARGVRHRFVAVLAVGVGAVQGGPRTYTAIAEWAHDLPVGVRVVLGLARRAPSGHCQVVQRLGWPGCIHPGCGSAATWVRRLRAR